MTRLKADQKIKKDYISPKTFIYFFINSDLNQTHTQILTLKLTLTQTQVKPEFLPSKQMKNA